MEGIGSAADLDISSRLITISIFLSILAFVAFYLISMIKSGKLKLPKFLANQTLMVKGLSHNSKDALKYSVNLIERKALPDGTELMIVDINGRHMLLAKTLANGINYLTDLNKDSGIQAAAHKAASSTINAEELAQL